MKDFPYEEPETENVKIYHPRINPPVFSKNIQNEGIINEMAEIRIWSSQNKPAQIQP